MASLKVEADKVINRLKRSLDLSKNLQPILYKIRGNDGDQNQNTIIGRFTNQFSSQGGLGGDPWKDLSDRYAKWKAQKYPGKTILRATDTLFLSLISKAFGNVDIVTERTLEYGTAIPYASFHQKGTGKMPARPIWVEDPELYQLWKNIIADSIKESMTGG